MTFQETILAPQEILVRSRLHHPGTLRCGSGRGHHGARNISARSWSEALSRVAYVQPSRRPADGRYGENPNRLYKHQQLQVILKPSPADVIDQYLGSLTPSASILPSTTSSSKRTTGKRRPSAPGASAGR